MKKFRFYLMASMLLTFSLSVFASSLPLKVETAFKKMYPEATNVEWEQIGSYYIADFIMNNNEVDVWYKDDGQWIMTGNDVKSLESVPAPVAQAFMKSTMASMKLKEIRIGSFPQHPTVIFIEVEGYNSDEDFQLFYTPEGKLFKSLNTNEPGAEVYPELLN